MYYPEYRPKNAAKFSAMSKLLGNCETLDDLHTAQMLYVLDLSYPREDILVVVKRVSEAKGWGV